MKRRSLIAGNWKMHKTPQETEAFLDVFLAVMPRMSALDVLLIPPYTSLDRAGQSLQGTGISLGAQDLHFEPSGAYTGAISGTMLVACGCSYVLVGHSERRHTFGDDDAAVRRKLEAALNVGLSPILCIGELLEERRSGRTEEVLVRQLGGGLDGLDEEKVERVVVAYEPVWAIGTGETATPQIAQETIATIRGWLANNVGERMAVRTRVLYGGSVKPENTLSLLVQPDIDGALVGGASLEPTAFSQILDAALAATEEG